MSVYLLAAPLVAVAVAAISMWARPTQGLHLPDAPYSYASVELPPHFRQPGRNDDNTPPDNPLTDHGATLGRVLFYDTRLSANRTTSCASCHVQSHAFSDPRPASSGFHGALTDRRAMPLVNLRYYQRGRFFWDERAGNLEEMVLQPIQSRVEMGQNLKSLVDWLAHDSMYRGLFERAFGDSEITEQRIGKALAQFVRSLVSYQSRYDEGRAPVGSTHHDFDNFTRQENRGKALFLRHCGDCHMRDSNEHFFVPTPAHTGLRPDEASADGGVGDVTLHAADLGAFKAPSLRNVEVTAPYGHDGRFATLDAVIDHYSENAISDPTLGYVIPVGPLKFTSSEKAALTAFLRTLTDRVFLSDAKFANPFPGQRDRAAVAIRSLNTGSPPRVTGPTRPNPAAVMDRLLSFDANRDDRIAPDELPERMSSVLSRGDKNRDRFLTRNELVVLADTALAVPRQGNVIVRRPDDLAGVIADLKLPAATHNEALAIVRAPRNLSDPASGDLDSAMRKLLNDEDYENFVAAAARLRASSRAAGVGVGVGVGHMGIE
jgi:cytochrome c peroxidase